LQALRRAERRSSLSMGTKELVTMESPPTATSPGVGARVFQNTVVLLAGRGFNLALSLVTSVLLARYLGSELLGRYGAILAYVSLFGWLATFGVEPILGREAAQRREQATSILFTGMMVGLSFALTGTFGALLLAPHFGYGGQMRLLLLLAAMDIIVLTPIRLPGIIFQVEMRQWYGVGIVMTRQVLWLAALVLLTMGQAAFFWVIFARMLCGVAEAVLTLYLSMRPGLLAGPWRILRADVRTIVISSFPIAMSGVATGIYNRIDQVMLHSMSSDHVLGRYVLAVNISELFTALPLALMSALFPVLARAAGDETRFRHYTGLSFRFLMAIVFGLCAVLIPVAEPVLRTFYGTEFAPAAHLLIVLIWSEVPVFFGLVMAQVLVARDLQRYLPLSAIVGATMNIGLNLIFIPRWDALGASWATVVSYTFASVLMYLCFRSTRSYAWQGARIALLPCALALGITGALHFLPAHFVVKFILAAALYCAGAILTQIVRRSEWERATGLLGSVFTFRRTEAA